MNKLQRYLEFLEKKRTNSQRYKLIFYIFTFNLLFLLVFNLLWIMIFPELLEVHKYYFSLKDIFYNFNQNMVPSLVVVLLAVIFEELLYRFPIFFLYRFDLKVQYKIFSVLGLIFAFTLGHFTDYDLYDLLHQFPYAIVDGICITSVYILSGVKDRRIIIPLFSVISYHFLLNFITFLFQGVPPEILVK